MCKTILFAKDMYSFDYILGNVNFIISFETSRYVKNLYVSTVLKIL